VRSTLVCITLCAILFIADYAMADVFGEGIFFPTAGTPSAVITAELDGLPGVDIATVSNVTGTMSILLADGNGGYAPPVEYGVSDPGSWRFDLCAADFDNDNDLDLAIMGSLLISIQENDGSGVFSNAGTIATLYAYDQDICTGDIDGDQQVDLLYSQRNLGGRLWMSLNSGSLTFADPVQLSDFRSWQPVCSYIDEDDHLDVVFHRWSTYECVLMLGNGDGSFQSPLFYPVSGATGSLTGLAVGDEDGDGDNDIFIGQHTSSPPVHLLTNMGSGVFSASTWIHTPASHYINELALADLDGEGCVDMAAVCEERWSEIALNDCNASFTTQYPTPYQLSSDLVISDLDGDGDQDLILASAESDSVLVWYSTVVIPRPDLSIVYDNGELILNWTDIGFSLWEVYRLSDPLDEISDGELIATVSETTYLDPDAFLYPASFYAVRGVTE